MAAPGCFVTTFRRNLENELPADTEQCPPRVLALGLNHEDFIAAMAPKPVILLTKERDYFDIRGAEAAYGRLRQLYRLLKAEKNIAFSPAQRRTVTPRKIARRCTAGSTASRAFPTRKPSRTWSWSLSKRSGALPRAKVAELSVAHDVFVHPRKIPGPGPATAETLRADDRPRRLEGAAIARAHRSAGLSDFAEPCLRGNIPCRKRPRMRCRRSRGYTPWSIDCPKNLTRLVPRAVNPGRSCMCRICPAMSNCARNRSSAN